MHWNIPVSIVEKWPVLLPPVNPHSSSAYGKGIDRLHSIKLDDVRFLQSEY